MVADQATGARVCHTQKPEGHRLKTTEDGDIGRADREAVRERRQTAEIGEEQTRNIIRE